MEIGTTSPRGKDMKRSMRRCSRLSYTWSYFYAPPDMMEYILDLSVYPSVYPLGYHCCEDNILRTHELILMQIATSGPWGKAMAWSTLGSGGQRLRSN